MKLCKICDKPTNDFKINNYTCFCSDRCFRNYQNEYENERNTKQCKINPKKYHKPWTDEDIAKLLQLRKDKYTYAQLVCVFDGRTIYSIKAKLRTLNKSEEEMEIIRKRGREYYHLSRKA